MRLTRCHLPLPPLALSQPGSTFAAVLVTLVSRRASPHLPRTNPPPSSLGCFRLVPPPGYYCDVRSNSKRAAECGTGACAAKPASCYCPAGTNERKIVSVDYYTIGDSVTTRYKQEACPSGYSCADGLRSSSAGWENCAGGTVTFIHEEESNGLLGDRLVANVAGTPSTLRVPCGLAWLREQQLHRTNRIIACVLHRTGPG